MPVFFPVPLPRFDAPNLHRVASSGRCSVNVWGSISKDGLGPLVCLDGSFRAAAYTDLLDTMLIPYALNGPFKDGLFFSSTTGAQFTPQHQ